MKTEFKERLEGVLKDFSHLVVIRSKITKKTLLHESEEIERYSKGITILVAKAVLKAIGEPHGYGGTIQDALEAKAKNSFGAEIKAKVFAELGIKEKSL